MLTSEARVSTEKAQRYIDQLGKHFAHKVQVDQEKGGSTVHFGMGICRMKNDGDELVLFCSAKDSAALQQVQHVMADHLVRFAWREELNVIWQERP